MIVEPIPGNMGVDCSKMGLGCISPMDLHSVKPYFARTSFTSLVRSSLLSAKPRSITSRTYISFMRSSIPCGIWRHPVDQLVGFVLLKDHRHEISSFIVQTVTPNQGDFKSSLTAQKDLRSPSSWLGRGKGRRFKIPIDNFKCVF